jgi:MFS family permease
LAVLTLISAFNYLDRSLLGLALPSIKREMHLSDTVLGLVSGLAFVLFYSTLGVPIAWAADRWNRRNILATGLVFWSLMTAFTSLVKNGWQLATARFLMGAGEACGTAPSTSMLSDLFDKGHRPLALAIFQTAISISFIFFYPIAGWICDHRGWREAFVAAGAPGFPLALLLILSVREPARGAADRGVTALDPHTIRDTLRFLAGSASYRFILLGVVFMGAVVQSGAAWNTMFIVRVHHWNITRVASVAGPTQGVFGAVGSLLGGALVNNLGRRDGRWRLWVPAIACLLVAPATVVFLLGDRTAVWITGMAFSYLLAILHLGPIYAACLSVAKVRMRAVATSLALLSAGLFGQVFGPLLVGRLNDVLLGRLGQMGIRYSMLVVPCGAVVAAVSFFAAAQHVERDMQRALA